jgi:methylated-DNA-protein-cysteine methyltransferase-like protein
MTDGRHEMNEKGHREQREKGSTYERIYGVVRQVPSGRVATYGQIAAIAGRCTPRMVGYAMAAVPYGSDIPWHRVLNSQGKSSLRGQGADIQRQMLEAEGVRFDESGRVDLSVAGWRGAGRQMRSQRRRG